MNHLDCGCFVGTWPFHKVRKPTFADLRSLHMKNGIAGGFISSTNAIFWNDPWEAELDLAKALVGFPTYRHVMTVNPTQPGTWDDLERAHHIFPVAGIRILPGFHGYTLSDDCAKPLWDWLRRHRVPLFLSMRVEDERVTHLFHPRSLTVAEVDAFLKAETGFPVVLSNIRDGELPALRETILARDDVFADTAGFKGSLFFLDDLAPTGLLPRVLYGSYAPIHCLKSTLLVVETSKVTDSKKNAILTAENFLKKL
ncbi:MAG: hypothetical protein VB111_01485 [Clostridiaceae bacterium]|nr:hypothetical protein [Clostridiaceae bacterium]